MFKILILFISFIININLTNCQTDTTIYESVDFAPYLFSDTCCNVFDYNDKKRCSDSLLIAVIHDNIVYPNRAYQLLIEGTVVVAFVVRADSTISDVSIRKKVQGGCDEEAVRIVHDVLSKKIWIPGIKNDQNVNVRYNLTIQFVIRKFDPSTRRYNYKEANDIKNYNTNNDISPNYNGGTIYVKGYYKKDGTYVKPHTRKR